MAALSEIQYIAKSKKSQPTKLLDRQEYSRKSVAQGRFASGSGLEMKFVLKAETEQDFHMMGVMAAKRKRY